MLFRNRWLPPVVLIGVVAFAVAAVAMLTGTITAAQQIEDDVKVIEPTVAAIDEDLDNVKLAAKTNQIALRILDAAEPLSNQAEDTLKAARSIDKTVPSILDTAESINDTAKAIGGTVDSINGNVNSIGGKVDSIQGTVHSINSEVLSINGSVQSIGGSVSSINRSGKSILSRVRSIDAGAAGINRRARLAIAGLRPVGSDLRRILSEVGAGSPAGHGNTIHGHANSIDCSPGAELLRELTTGGGARYCDR